MSQQPEQQPWDRAARDAEIIAKYGKGLGPSAIASGYGLSSERVRQILRAAGVWKRPAVTLNGKTE